jgi:signal transduction histidine kinase/ActR/RegA family two-component response regulator
MIGRARLPVVFSALVAVIAIVIVWLAQLHNDRMALIRHTLEVENALSDMSSAVFQAEAMQRGYIITGQDAFRRQYDRARAGMVNQSAKLGLLTKDNAAQQAAVAKLRVATRRKFAELDGAMTLRRVGDPKADDSLHNGSTGALTAQIALTLRAMRTTEQGLLTARTHEAERLDIALLMAVAGSAVLVVAFSGLWVAQAGKAGAALETAYGELSEVNAELLSEMASRAAAEGQVRQMQKMEAVGQLTGGIAHDFNNMLAVILGNLNMIQRRLAKGKTDVGVFVEAAVEGANRAATLTERLLAFSRQQPLRPEAVEPNRLVSGMSDLLNRTLGETIAVETVLGADLWRTRADAAQLESALVNLALNARDAMPDGGKLTIETGNTHLDTDYADAGARQGEYVMIAVTDTGEGMAPEVVEKAIEPFFTTKPVGKGTGLGLSQVYGFVKQTGGYMRVYSELGQGSTVKIYLPRLLGPVDEPEEPEPRAKAAWRSEAHHMVLVVEDDERVRQFVAAALRELGYRVVDADSASRALIRLKAEPDVALLLTDIIMPETNGRELADLAVQLKPGLPVLYMTGFTRNAMAHKGALDPGVNFLPKPFTIDQLAAKVREAIEGAKV